jgi:oligopeptide/dipeptide ABC transporter ATP-binding protein
MYAGELVEIGPTREVLFRPRHPYTAGLIASLPEARGGRRLRPIAGVPPEAGALPAGCAFASRCGLAVDACRAAPIPLLEVEQSRSSRCIRVDHIRDLAAREPSAPAPRLAVDGGRSADG